jgi:hypothetical protein
MWVAYFVPMIKPWFSRLWALQEVLLARVFEVWCGSQTVAWIRLTFLLGSPPVLDLLESSMLSG